MIAALPLSAAATGAAALLFTGTVPWPFPFRPSLVVLDDPEMRREVGLATLAIAAALFAVGIGAAVRRLRWAGFLAALALAVPAIPHLRSLLVEAYPTSYARSPTGFASAGIVQGGALFARHCAGCHGAEGRGDGPDGRSLADPPADLTAAHLWEHEDGELFWWLSHGIDGPEGGLVMPGFAARLPAADRWDLIDYLRAHNAGLSMRRTGGWAHPVAAPGFTARCPNGTTVTNATLRGRVLRLVLAGGEEPPTPLPGPPGASTVDLYAPRPPDGVRGCAIEAPAFVAALATLTDTSAEALAGAQFLIDPDGYLRARHTAGQADGWSDTASLIATVGRICAHPITSEGGGNAQAP